jgi:hypothetical protein
MFYVSKVDADTVGASLVGTTRVTIAQTLTQSLGTRVPLLTGYMLITLGELV